MKSKVDVKKAFDLIKSKHDSGIMLLYKNGLSSCGYARVLCSSLSAVSPFSFCL